MNLPRSSSSLSQQSTSGIVQNYRKALPKRPGKVGSGLPGVPLCPWDMGLGAGDPWHGQVVLGPYYPLYYFSGSFSILGLWLVEAETQPSSEKWGCWGSTYGWSHWVRVPAPPCCFLAGCTVSPLQSPTASLTAVGKSLLLPIGATLWGRKCSYHACELCCESDSKRTGKCCSSSRERRSLTNICLCKSNHLSSEMFILPFPWLYFLNCHMYFLGYFSLVKLRREGLTINLGYIPNKVMFVILTV